MIEQEWTSARERHPAEMKPEDYDVYSSAKCSRSADVTSREVDLPQDQDTHAPMIVETTANSSFASHSSVCWKKNSWRRGASITLPLAC